MKQLVVWIFLVWALLLWTGAQADERAADNADTPFWLAPEVDPGLTLRLDPAPVTLVAGPDRSRQFALLQTGDEAPSANFVSSNPVLVPFIPREDTGYRVVRGGLKKGGLPYGDRKYQLQELDTMFLGLPLLQTMAGHKAIVDARYSVILSVEKPCFVFVAIDERAIQTFKLHGTPSWLNEFAPTGHKIVTDDPLMAASGASYLVFVRTSPAGRIALGAPGMAARTNSMYFAFFAEAD